LASKKVRKIAVLELLCGTDTNVSLYSLFRKQFFGVACQSISAWCRRAGHVVHYETYYGQCAPDELVPSDTEVVFLSSFTESAALAYALAKLFGQRGIRTILGGPHAQAFPQDAARFFDVVVLRCDENLVNECLRDDHPKGTILTSTSETFNLPLLAERRGDLDHVSLLFGRYSGIAVAPILSSLGCPYDCNFCVDWNQQYRLRNSDDLHHDLEYASTQMRGRVLTFYDPNFGVNFDKTVGVVEQIQHPNPYVMESSLTILKEPRLARLQSTNCMFIAPGIESWYDYGRKTGTQAVDSSTKFTRISDQFSMMTKYVPGLQANFMFGTEADEGDEPALLTRLFIRQFPNVFPGLAVPIPFGGTPLRDAIRQQGRLLPLPCCYYIDPLPTFRFKHYSMTRFYKLLATIYQEACSVRMGARRMLESLGLPIRLSYLVRTMQLRHYLKLLYRFSRLLVEDRQVANFNNGVTDEVPLHYDNILDKRLGRYSSLLSRDDRHFLGTE